MKKTIIILSALIALVGCNKENTQPENAPNVFNITITREGDTKAVKANWENGDVVYVFFSTVAAPNYVKYTFDGTDWSNTKVGTFDITTAGYMTAIYLPYGNTETVSTDGTNFKFENTYTSYYLKAEKAPYTVSGGVVSGSLNMVVPDGFVQFAMPISGTVHDGFDVQFFRETAGAYTLKESHLTPCAFASVAADGTISNMTGVDYTAGKPITGYIYGGDINFSGILSSAGSPTDYEFNFVNNMGTVETYDDVTYILTGNKTIAARAAIKFPLISSSSWTVPEPGYVTVGTYKWAKWNVGATTETGYGDYFAWSEIYPRYRYLIEDYRGIVGDNNIDVAHDVAYQKLGENWQMPTKLQLNALLSKISSSTWMANYLGTGVNGYLIAPDTGFESEGSLFLPAAGVWYDMLHDAGDDGYYWSSAYSDADYVWEDYWYSINYNTYFAWNLYFSIHYDAVVYEDNRSIGFSVRPVHN